MKETIADKLTERIAVTMDGRDIPIVVTHNVLIETEKLTGLNVFADSAAGNILNPSATIVRAVLYLSMVRAGARVTLEQVGDAINPGNLSDIRQAITAAWVASMPVPEAEGNANPTEADAG